MAITLKIDKNIVVITIDRPQAMNAIDPQTNLQLGEAWDEFSSNQNLRVAVLTGAGDRAFCAGADLKTFIPAQREAVAAGQTAHWGFGGGLTKGRVIKKPVIAAINGHCLAGGMEIALACDIRICSPHATFGLAEVKWGLIPGAGGTQRLPRTVPIGMALEMILSGDPIDADTAYRIGLVNRIVERAKLVDAACELATKIASRAPLAVEAARRAVYAGIGRDFEAGMAIEELLFNEVVRTEDADEGPRAFAEKRPPNFKYR